MHRYGGSAPADIDIDSADVVLDERNSIYVTSIPGCGRWLDGSESLEPLSLEETTVLKGNKDRVVAHGQKEIGLVVKCYNGLENNMKVCDIAEIIGILEMPEQDEENIEVIVHAVTMRKKRLNDIILARHSQLSTGLPINHNTNL